MFDEVTIVMMHGAWEMHGVLGGWMVDGWWLVHIREQPVASQDDPKP